MILQPHLTWLQTWDFFPIIQQIPPSMWILNMRCDVFLLNFRCERSKHFQDSEIKNLIPRTSTPKPHPPVIKKEHLTPDFIVFLMSHNANEEHLRLPFLLVEVKPVGPEPFFRLMHKALPQLFLQARFALEKYPDLTHVYSMCIIGLDWRLFSFARGATTELPQRMRSTELPKLDSRAIIRWATPINAQKVSLLDASGIDYHYKLKTLWKQIATEHGVGNGLSSNGWWDFLVTCQEHHLIHVCR